MSSRIRKTTSTLLAVSIFLSYGVNLYADDESTDIEEISVIETEDVTEESGEDLILCEEPEEETVEAEPETPEDPVNIEIADSGDVVIEDEDVIDISPAANEIVINVDFVNELGEPWMLYSNSQISGMYFIKTGLIDDFSVNVKVYDVNGVLLHEGDADYTDADFNSEGQLDLFKRLNNVGYDYRTDPEYFSREGVVRAVITVTDYDGQIVAVKPSEEYHSRMLVDGTEVTDPITLDVDQGDSVNVTLYPAKGLTGNFGFYDYAGLLDDERYVHNFS
ncbi:MAG: hypothetical protein J5883_05410, partial [Clostridiales bacterium]|nr:hypothetical protein [Clostridiales bacterium]